MELVLASVKGVGFVLVTATLLLILACRYFQNLEMTQERYTRLFENAVEGLTLFRWCATRRASWSTSRSST